MNQKQKEIDIICNLRVLKTKYILKSLNVGTLSEILRNGKLFISSVYQPRLLVPTNEVKKIQDSLKSYTNLSTMCTEQR